MCDNYRIYQYDINGDLISLGNFHDADGVIDIGVKIELEDKADVKFKAKIIEIYKAKPEVIKQNGKDYEPDPIVIVGNKRY